MRKQIVEGRADLQKTLRGSLLDNLAGDLLDECFPVRRWDVRLVCDFLAVGILA
jgi:hypothetical protein